MMLERLRLQKEILASRSKIFFLKEKVSYKKNNSSENYTITSAKNELSLTLQKIHNLNSKLSDVNIKISNNQNEIQNLQSMRESLLDKETETLYVLEHLGSKKNEVEINILQLNVKIKEPDLEIARLRLDILGYENILDSTPPEPRYRLDGEFCINGIHLCKNHPPRQILENENEIDEFTNRKANAQKQLARLQNKLSRLLDDQNELKAMCRKAEHELKMLEADLEHYQTELQNIQESIHLNHLNITQAQCNLQNFQNEASDISSQIYTLQDSANYFENILNNHSVDKHSSDETQSLLESEIENLALLEIQLENLEQTVPDRPNNPTFSATRLTEEELEALALQQLMDEKSSLTQTSSSFFNQSIRGINNARKNINEAVQDLKDSAKAGLRNLVPGAVHETATNVFMNQAELVSGAPVTKTGDVFADRTIQQSDEMPSQYISRFGQ